MYGYYGGGYSDYSGCCDGYGGYYGGGTGYGYYHGGGNTFVLIVVLFILLIIVGSSFLSYT